MLPEVNSIPGGCQSVPLAVSMLLFVCVAYPIAAPSPSLEFENTLSANSTSTLPYLDCCKRMKALQSLLTTSSLICPQILKSSFKTVKIPMAFIITKSSTSVNTAEHSGSLPW